MNLRAFPVGWQARSHFTAPFAVRASSASLGRVALGETEMSWFTRAKAAVAKYDDLSTRAAKIADPAYSSGVLGRFRGNPADPAGALYRRNSVAFAVAQAESVQPVNYSVFVRPEVQGRVAQLERWNRELDAAVMSGETRHGVTQALGQGTAPAPAPAAVEKPPEVCPFSLLVLGAVALGAGVLAATL